MCIVRRQYSLCNVETCHFDSVPIQNERLLNYKAGSKERTEVKTALAELLNQVECVPIVINGNEMHDNCHLMQNLPYNRSHCVARYVFNPFELKTNIILLINFKDTIKPVELSLKLL